MSGLSLRVTVTGDLDAMMQSEIRAGARAVKAGVGGATMALKDDWRAQVRGANLGARLANSIRGEVYPKGRDSANAGGLVYAKAPKIIDAHDKGEVIRAKDGVWLAIPLPPAGKGVGGAKVTPAQWEQRTGRQLRFVYRRGRTAMLVDVGKVAPGGSGLRSRMSRKGFHSTFQARGFSNRSVPMFILTPLVRLKNRMDLMSAAERIGATVPGRIITAWRD